MQLNYETEIKQLNEFSKNCELKIIERDNRINLDRKSNHAETLKN